MISTNLTQNQIQKELIEAMLIGKNIEEIQRLQVIINRTFNPMAGLPNQEQWILD